MAIIEAEAGSAKAFLKKLGKVEVGSFFDWENFNPDAEMDREELMKWIQFIGNGRRPLNVANFWFPNERGRLIAVINLRQYLWNKYTAMGLRLAGNINRALEYEGICDRIYNRLPDYARW